MTSKTKIIKASIPEAADQLRLLKMLRSYPHGFSETTLAEHIQACLIWIGYVGLAEERVSQGKPAWHLTEKGREMIAAPEAVQHLEQLSMDAWQALCNRPRRTRSARSRARTQTLKQTILE